MANPRIEEVSDSDPEVDDPSTYLPSDAQHPIQPASQSTANRAAPRPQAVNPTLFRPPPPSASSSHTNETVTRASVKSHCTLYPVYFDSTRTRSQGRRVHESLAIENPLAYNLLLALRHILTNDLTPFIQLPLTLEPDKTHPKDWANPGRVRIQLFDTETHKPLHPGIRNKPHLYKLVGKYLQAHPTKKEDTLKLKIPGLPVPEDFTKLEIAKPRGLKMGSILPVHSAAASGGGVSDNFFKEAMEEMKEMQKQQGGGGMPGMGGGGMPDMNALQNMMGGMGGMGGGAGGGGGGGKRKGKKG